MPLKAYKKIDTKQRFMEKIAGNVYPQIVSIGTANPPNKYTQLQIDQAKLGELIDLVATVPFTHDSLNSKDILGPNESRITVFSPVSAHDRTPYAYI